MIPARRSGVLYISYDGVLEPLGQSQVLAYLERLATDWPIFLISFEKPQDQEDAERMAAMHERLRRAGVSWTPVAYHKWPSAPATAYDICVGISMALLLVARHRIAFMHVRSYVPALIALAVKKATGVKLLFDMRGFWADERIDGGLWPADGVLYKTAKSLERNFLEAADHVVTLTHASARELESFSYLIDRMRPLSVIPTCADLDRFRPRSHRPDGPFVLGYAGSVGTWYLFDEFLAFYSALRARLPDARLLIVSQSECQAIEAAMARARIDPATFELIAADPEDMPTLIGRMDAGGAIIKRSYSKIASAPTKLAEYLGCGIPCVGNVGVGDMAEILEGREVGVALTDFSPADHARAVDRLLALLDRADIQSRCVETARDLFSLDAGVAAYHEIYSKLSATS